MNWFRPLGIAGLAWQSVAAVADRGALWVPVLVVAVVQAAILLLLAFFHQPELIVFAGPLVQILGGEAALHYPGHFQALPGMFANTSLVVDILLAWVALGVTTLRFATAYGLPHQGDAWGVARRAARALAGIAFLSAGPQLALSAVIAGLPPSARPRALPELTGRLLLAVGLQLLLAYATPYVVLRGRSMAAAIVDSVHLTRRAFAPTLIMVAVPLGALLPLSLAVQEWASATALRPTLVVATLGIRTVVSALVTFVTVGSLTRFFLSKTGAEP